MVTRQTDNSPLICRRIIHDPHHDNHNINY
nr:MAG TPA: hypothetical protein [Caudoviricetes sp.]